VHVARRGKEYGFRARDVRVSMAAVKRRKDAVVKQSSDGVAKWIAGMKNVKLVRGHARFTGPNVVSVNGRSFPAPKIFINVGARALVPDMPGVKDVPYLTNTSMMGLASVPEHLLIVGGSYVGLEFAQMYRRFGAKVTVVEKSARFLPREDDDIAAEIRAVLEREGVRIRTGAECMRLEKKGRRVRVGLECEKGAPMAEGSHVLLAVGRLPNTHDLGLQNAKIELDERGYIKVDDECRTNVEGVWALGDVNGRGAFTHTSYNDYEIVAANLFDGGRRRIADRIPAYALFIDPPLGRAGMNEHEARKSGKRILAAKMQMARVGRAREAGETQGFMKVEGASRRLAARIERRRGRAFAARRDVCEEALHHHPAGDAHPSHGQRAHPDAPRRPETPLKGVKAIFL
jgi:pyruvate/2-oxoglutarate dehydrogenase complex dihydrolipoamide dehydrogenase (E3) component